MRELEGVGAPVFQSDFINECPLTVEIINLG